MPKWTKHRPGGQARLQATGCEIKPLNNLWNGKEQAASSKRQVASGRLWNWRCSMIWSWTGAGHGVVLPGDGAHMWPAKFSINLALIEIKCMSKRQLVFAFANAWATLAGSRSTEEERDEGGQQLIESKRCAIFLGLVRLDGQGAAEAALNYSGDSQLEQRLPAAIWLTLFLPDLNLIRTRVRFLRNANQT